jgi:hypothetical protein
MIQYEIHFRKNQKMIPGSRIPTKAKMPMIICARNAFLWFSGVRGAGGLPQSSSFESCSLKSFSIYEYLVNQPFLKIKEIKDEYALL